MKTSFNVAHFRQGVLKLWAPVLLMSLSACTILPEAPVSQVYLLPAQSAVSHGAPGVCTSLRVIQPNSSHFLNSSRIAVQPQNAEITSYSGARWSDPAPVLLRNRLIQEFRVDGSFKSVSSDEDNLRADTELSGDVVSFQGVYQGNQGEVVIRYDARLVRTSDRTVIASRSFMSRQPINGRSMDEVVRAFGLAGDHLAAQILVWTQRTVCAPA